MPHLTDRIEINASPDAVWAILGDLAATPAWLPGTVSAQVDNGTRICTMADGSQVHEQIDNYSAETRSYAWKHLQVRLPVRDSHGKFTVVPNPAGHTTVVLDTWFEPLQEPDEVTPMIQTAFRQSLESLRRFIEQGTRWND
ncbi:polyketide cyclase/dehydrase/lipid transport protein [Kribbella sp. VKM Ac-2527]|uniref:Polyketide cyclase/dehydrase/lipid transport protein n=1 Tax=Kribbella caucasensis TaxID=2512215 RepID=A0A4R6JNU3_9ACTN|nr:SRPBCC family protein [Kribbella sp. VKM Ac-2527]TDO36295.1 polyketide cyclase/dehydrase/lipid transport protein [Kribbella sp. VKM Ac-2527]